MPQGLFGLLSFSSVTVLFLSVYAESTAV